VKTTIRRALGLGLLAVCIGWAQTPAQPVTTIEQPDAQRTREELSQLLEKYPPTLRNVLVLDPTLLANQAYLAPYPGLVSFLSRHPEVARNPTFYIGEAPRPRPDAASLAADMWRDVVQGLAVFTGFGMAIGLIVWLIRTLIDYRRWSRLAKVQTDVHTKLLDRFTANDDLIAYIQSPAGSKFLESSPIKLDPGPRSVGAPLSRILWSVQGGLVLMALGVGLQVVGRGVTDEAAQPLHALGVLAIALGLGFVISAIISYVISRKLGLIEPAAAMSRAERPVI
jgi:hypothetical protein